MRRLATIALSVGDCAAARHDAEQALQLARTLGYRWGEGVALLRLGQALHVLGDYTRGCDVVEGALAIFHEIGDRTYEAATLAYRGRLSDSLGDYARAQHWLEQALIGRPSKNARADRPACRSGARRGRPGRAVR